MAERFKAPVLKTGEGQLSVGSNPTPTANMGRVSGLGLGGGSGMRIASGEAMQVDVGQGGQRRALSDAGPHTA